MKTVFFIRHAKSSWSDSSLRDIQRPLNKRGLRDAPFMAKMLKGTGVSVDQIISSPANRAFTTATYFAEAFEISKGDIFVNDDIYEAYASTVIDIVKNLPDHLDTVLVFGHNPTFTSIANNFTKNYIANLPTCGIVQVTANINNWSDLNESTGQLTAIHYPKQYFD